LFIREISLKGGRALRGMIPERQGKGGRRQSRKGERGRKTKSQSLTQMGSGVDPPTPERRRKRKVGNEGERNRGKFSKIRVQKKKKHGGRNKNKLQKAWETTALHKPNSHSLVRTKREGGLLTSFGGGEGGKRGRGGGKQEGSENFFRQSTRVRERKGWYR